MVATRVGAMVATKVAAMVKVKFRGKPNWLPGILLRLFLNYFRSNFTAKLAATSSLPCSVSFNVLSSHYETFQMCEERITKL
jgi:hypothetical protein